MKILVNNFKYYLIKKIKIWKYKVKWIKKSKNLEILTDENRKKKTMN